VHAGLHPVERVAGDAACGAADLAALDARYNGEFTWPKARYVRYTDKTFTQRWAPPTADAPAPPGAGRASIFSPPFSNSARHFFIHGFN
jgi:hypothetical protein